MESKNIIYNPRLDELRGIACLLVFILHSELYKILPFGKNFFISFGVLGVGLFFVLSGYLFTNIFYKKDTIHYKNFIINRFLRIIPLFFIILLVIIITHFKVFQPSFILYLLTFTWNIPFNNGDLLPIKGYGYIWTIAVEFHFYFLLPLLYKYKNYIWIFILWFIGIRFFLYHYFPQYSSIYYFSDITRFNAFLIGMGLAFWEPKIKIIKQTSFIFTLAPIILLYIFTMNTNTNNLLKYEVIYILLSLFLLSYCHQKRIFYKKYKLLNLLGIISYSFYLNHLLILKIIYKVFSHTVLSSLIAFLLTIIISIFTYNLIEKPFMKLRKKY